MRLMKAVVPVALALLCSGAGFVAMGVFFSSLTRNQVVAGVFTAVMMVLMMALIAVKRLVPAGSVWATLVTYVSFIDLWGTALQGKLALKDLGFHISAAVFWLFLTVKVLESRRWR